MATLKFASWKLDLPIPTTVLYDISSDNRKDLTRKITKLILDTHELSHGNCAFIGDYNDKTPYFEMQTLSIPPDPDYDGSLHSLPADKRSDTLKFITTICQRWKNQESTYLRKPISGWDRCSDVAKEMYDYGFPSASNRVPFTHMDLYPRNILINITSDSLIEIIGVLDWDDALFVPKYVACQAPF
ncbi:hypothetical protein BU25DRAFT_458222 [Macroventuria anomochaeta]|uniref:Uncharacterized protein n=1 Tax=Macroventuria anomochaeta TaxID=301207 RepID=A0ACB6S3V4_9PLEO|nr:uncharacterized protein BU25DRAFT_458222 [Macroventuria anomochaeta]KAF2627817.1 hypothetical protein BU25DRAFT_458222 [Macroventuria anomochaeta]